jgi:mRNA-degrading endonuclease RelE of RelBE toxin-antitoxin system
LKYYQVIFLEGARRFLQSLDKRIAEKILFVVAVAQQKQDPKLFKKIQGEIWEFRVRYMGLQIRLLSFWDKEPSNESLVVVAVGLIKKKDKIPKDEINKTEKIRKKYFEQKGGRSENL